MKPNRSSLPFARSAPQLLLPAFAACLLAVPSAAVGQKSAHTPAHKLHQTVPTIAPVPAPLAPQADEARKQADAYYHAMLAHNYEEDAMSGGQPELAKQAITEYEAALADDPASPQLHTALAELYFRTGQEPQAIEAAKAEVARNPNSLPAHKLLGRIYLRALGDGQGPPQAHTLQMAIAEYTRIVQLEPDNIEDHLLLGQLYSFAKDSTHAQQQFAEAQKIDPHSEEVVLNMARIDSERNDLHGAVQVLSSLPDGDQTAKTEYALGATYDQLKQPKQAITAYRKSLALEPDNLDVERALAQSLRSDGQNKAALDAYDDIIAGDPSDSSAYLHAAEIERAEGRYTEALGNLQKAASLATDSLEIAYDEAVVYQKLGRYAEAEQMLQRLVAASEHTTGKYTDGEKNNYALFLDHLASVYRDENRTDDAIATWNKMLPLGGDYTLSAYGAEVDTLREAHEYDKGLALLQQATAKFPKNRGLELALANQWVMVGKPDQGIELAKTLLNGTPADRDVYLSMAQIELSAKKWKNAEGFLDKASALSVTNGEKVAVLLERGMLADRQKHYDAAEDNYKQALAIDPDNSLVLNDYGYMLADRDVRLNEALSMLQKSNKLDPDNYATLDSLGWAYFKMGQYALAENNLLKATQHSAQDPTVHEHLGDLYEKTDRLQQAASQWEESLKLAAKTDPGDVESGESSRVQKKLDSARVRLARSNAGVGK
jgi:tetratricopeptide (TPR) repeat protein